MSLIALIEGLFLAHLYLHLAITLGLYLLPAQRFVTCEDYRFWPADWLGRFQAVAFVVLEYWAFYLFLLTYPLGWIVPRRLVLPAHPDPQDPRNAPVLLIHGYLMNRFCMLPLQLRLAWDGFRKVETISLRQLGGPIEAFSLQVRHRVAELDREAAGLGVTLVGHSMGGLVAAWALADPDTSRRVRGVIAVGSPFGGTLLYRGGIGLCARQFRPGGGFVRRVSERFAGGDAKRLVSIYSEGDRVILPPSHSHIEGALSNERLRYLGHMSLLLSPAVYRLVRQFLAGRKFADRESVLAEGARG